MKPELYERLMRTLVSAVLNSDLTGLELRKVCKELASDPDPFRDLLKMLSTVADGLSAENSPKKPERSSKFDSDRVEKYDARVSFLVDRLRRSKLPKSRVNELMSEISHNIPGSVASNLTLPQMIINFLENASDEQVHKLLSMIDSVPLEDDYLRGMSERQLDADR